MAVTLTTPAQPNDGRTHPGTLAFYDREAEAYCRGTEDNDLTALYPALLDRMPAGGLLLDAGSGSGRDTLAFLEKGYRVEAFDASVAMATMATALAGVEVEVARFETWSAPRDRYDGVWAFASLLHVPRADLPPALRLLCGSLRRGGHLFASFKWGHGDVVDAEGRHYTNLTLRSAEALFQAVPGLTTLETWRERGPTGLGSAVDWIYVLARRDGA